MNTRKKLRLAWHLSPQTSISVFDKRYMSNTYNIQEDNSTSITGVLTLRNPSIANRGGSKNDVADQNDATGLTQNSTSMWSYSGVLWKQTCQHSHEQQQSQQWWFLALCTPRTHVRPLKPVGILEWKIGSQPATYLNNFPGLDRKELDINGELKKKILYSWSYQQVMFVEKSLLTPSHYEKTVIVWARSIFAKTCRKV